MPLIKTSDAFIAFIKETPIGKRSIALLMHDDVILNAGSSAYIYAIVYEKHKDRDMLYIYDSDTGLNDYIEYYEKFFREHCILIFPDKTHKLYNQGAYDNHGTNACAIEDASILLTQVNEPFMVSLQNGINYFSLSQPFNYNEQAIRRKYLCELIELNEAGELLESKAALPL